MKKFFIVITGPTAAGKSAFAEQLAADIEGDIINGDMGQFYQPLTIGTAKPFWQTSLVPHHLFDILNYPVNFSVTEYRSRVIEVLESLWQRQRIPLIVGGSSFYIRSLFFPPQNLKPVNDNQAIFLSDQESTESLWKKLVKIDPARAQSIHPSDRYRTQRALMIWNECGKLPSELKPLYDPLGFFIILFVTRERADLYQRINERVKVMFKEGWCEEVERLSIDWKTFLKRKKIIGYDDILVFIQKEPSAPKTLNELQLLIAQKTRQYAKRQIIGWQSFKHAIESSLATNSLYPGLIKEINLTFSPLDLYINETRVLIRHFINHYMKHTHE